MNPLKFIESKIKYALRSINMCASGPDTQSQLMLLTDILRNQLLSTIPSDRLEHSESCVYSQNGEDGIIAEIFRRIGTTNKTFVEFGVGDGLQNNTRFLLQQGDWHGLWIEGSHEFCCTIQENCALYIKTRRLVLKESFITRDNIDTLISESFSGDIDLLSIDIDGNDLHIWNAIKSIHPRVLITEYNPTFPPPSKIVMPYNANHAWEIGTDYYGASLAAWEEQLTRDGYTLVGCELSGTNAFWVRSDLSTGKFDYPNSAVSLYHPARHCFCSRLPRGHRASPLHWENAACSNDKTINR